MMIESLRSNLSENIDNSNFIPQWHLDILNEREELIRSGDAKFSSLSDVRERLQNLETLQRRLKSNDRL